MLVRKLDQIRSRIPPEQLLYYQSEAGREAIHTEFRERLESMSQHEDGTHSPSAADTLERRLLDLTARSPRAISVCVRIPGQGEKDSGVNAKTIPG
jgi:hypothetical protein